MTNIQREDGRFLRWHLLGQLLFALLLWPAFSVWYAGQVVAASGVAGGTTLTALRWGCLVAAGLMWRELVLAGGLLTLSALAAARLGGTSAPRSRLQGLALGALSALAAAAALVAGVALELPAALHHPALRPAWRFPVWAVEAGILAALLCAALLPAWRRRSPARALRRLAAAAALVAAGFGLARLAPDGRELRAPSGLRIVLGLDSISRADAVEPLRRLTEEEGGTWYHRAVSPGLITNAVWWSIVTGAPPRQTGVFFIFQNPAPERLPENLVARARRQGLTTCSHFSDQLTMQVGAALPFDLDRSGPRGWLQVTTAAVKDAGWLLPVVLPHLPRLPGALTPPNQSHTYAFSLRRELSEILSCGGAAGGTLTLAHVDYLHQARYPGLSQLTAPERGRVWRAPLAVLVDRSIDWQYPVTAGEPLQLYAWKLADLQATLREAIRGTGVLSPAHRNQLVILSDHGPRKGLSAANFGEERFSGVVLATFGAEPRDPDAPVSLLDVGALVGLGAPGAPPAEPVVEYVDAPNREMRALARGSRPLLDGRVAFPREVLERIGARLQTFRPYGAQPGYSQAGAEPAPEPEGAAPTVISGEGATG